MNHNGRTIVICAWWRHQMDTFSALLALCAGNSPVTDKSPHKGQWRGALMFSFICAWINSWVNNRDAGDLRCHHAHYDVTVMWIHKNDLSTVYSVVSLTGQNVLCCLARTALIGWLFYQRWNNREIASVSVWSVQPVHNHDKIHESTNPVNNSRNIPCVNRLVFC